MCLDKNLKNEEIWSFRNEENDVVIISVHSC